MEHGKEHKIIYDSLRKVKDNIIAERNENGNGNEYVRKKGRFYKKL